MNKKRKILSWILVIIWMALIFIVSHQPATESEELSLGVTDIIAGFINRIVPNITIDTYILEHFIRKCAHFIEYMVLGVLVANGLLNHNKHKLKWLYRHFLYVYYMPSAMRYINCSFVEAGNLPMYLLTVWGIGRSIVNECIKWKSKKSQ